MLFRRPWVVVGLLIALLVPGPAFARLPSPPLARTGTAQTRTDLAVLVAPLDRNAEALAARIDHAAREAVERSGRFEVVRVVDALDGANAQTRRARAREGTEAAEAARAAYNDLDTNRSLEAADRAIRLLSETDLTVHLPSLTSAWITKIASLIANAENKAAEIEMDKLLAINPDAQFSPNLFPPDELAYAQKIKKQYDRANETMEIRTDPAGAEVYVDGRFQGVSPVTVKGLPPGEHFVTAKMPGHLLVQQRARPGTVELKLTRADAWPRYEAFIAGVRRDPEGKGRDAAARELASWMGVDQALVILVDAQPGVEEARLTVLRMEPKDGHNLAFVRDTVDTKDATLREVNKLVTEALSSDAERRGGPVTHFAAGSSGGSVKKTTGYVLLGTGLAVIAGGAYFGVQAQRNHELFRSLPQTSAEAVTTRRTGQRYAMVADLSFIGGAVAAGIGSYLAFLSGPKAGTNLAPAGASTAASGRDAAPSTAAPPVRSGADSDARAAERSKTSDHDDLRDD